MGKTTRTFTSPEIDLLEPGDCLLYSSGGPLPWLIKIKTWSPVSHVEVYRGGAKSIAARKEGVRTYDLRRDGLFAILRPLDGPLDLTRSLAWFDEPFNQATHSGVTGQRYDVWGLFRFFTIGKQSEDKQFCSEVATRFYRLAIAKDGAPFHPFATRWDADLVSPGMFLASDEFWTAWDVEKGWLAPNP